MAESRVITKELLGLEDILTGVGTVSQVRGGTSLPITKLNASNINYDATETIKDVLGKKATVLANVVAMQALVTVNGQTEYVLLRGYDVSGDSGGGLFWLDTSDTSSSEDLISIFEPDVAANGRWKRLDLSRSMSADNGDANLTLVAGDECIQLFDTVLTVNRTVTLPTVNLFKGMRFNLIYTTASAFTLAIDSVYTFGVGDSGTIDIQYDGTDWEVLSLHTDKSAPYAGDAGGTVDAITVSVGMKAYDDNDIIFLRSLGSNTVTAPTINVDSLGAKTIVTNGNTALAVDDLGPAGRELILKFNNANDNMELLNPAQYTGGTIIKAWGILTTNTAIDMSLGDLHIIEAGANITLTFSSSNVNDRATIAIQNGGGWTITVAGVDNNTPTLTIGTNVQDILGLIKSHGKITTVGLMDNVSAV